MSHDTSPSAPAIDHRGLLGIAFGPAALAVLLSALAQSLGFWHGRDVVAEAGGPAALLLGAAVLLYGVFGLMHGLHAVGDAAFGERTPLWWQPEQVSDDDGDGPVLAAATTATAAFPCHVDGLVLSAGMAFGCWLALLAAL